MNCKTYLWVLCCGAMIMPTSSFAYSNESISQELTTLYRAARKVISDNQSHINNAELGDKGLSGKAVSAIALENYAKVAGSKLNVNTMTEAQKAMLVAVENVMNENQALINEKGVGFKGFLPAIFARQVADAFTSKMSGKIKIKLTAPKSYVRNRANRPDAWENNIIETLFKQADHPKGKFFAEQSEVKGQAAFRFILPEYYGASCLNCHGEPKGERDITGGKKEGGVLGELGGAISLIIYQ